MEILFNRKSIFLLLLGICFTHPLKSEKESGVVSRLTAELTHTTNPEKRYTLLRDLADISSVYDTKFYYFKQLYNEAKQNKNIQVQIEALLELGNNLNVDSLRSYISLAEQLPPSNESKGLIVFLKGQYESFYLRRASAEEKLDNLKQLLDKYRKNQQKDIYERILDLRILCIHLGQSIQGDIYTKYMEEQEKLVGKLPPENYYLKTSILIQLALLYTNGEEYAKAIETDKKLLEYIHEREKFYKKQGRTFRNYYSFYYIIYRRMLNNYPALTPAEVDSCYNKMKDLCHFHEEVKKNFYGEDLRPHLYYHMAKKEYARALPYLKKALERKENTVSRHVLLRYQIEISRILGQKEELLKALEEYVKAIDIYNNNRAKEKYKELQVLFDIESLTARNAHLKLEKREVLMKAEHQSRLMTAYIAILLAFLLFTMFLFHLHNRRLIKRLQQSEKALQQEKASLLKTQNELEQARDQAQASDRIKSLFIQNMSHEIRTPLNAVVGFSQLLASETKELNPALEEYGNIIHSNSELLLNLVNDLLQLADIESGKLKVVKAPQPINEVCRIVISSIKQRIQTGVKLTFTPEGGDDLCVVTDPLRVQQILINFLNNAAKFTTEGEINLSYRIDKNRQKIIFAVTDTGPGVPPEKSEQIFKRFEKLDAFSQGNGLGLHICRLIARLLDGEVMLDPTYTGGARFLFTQPLS